MAVPEIEPRLAALEAEVPELKQRLEQPAEPRQHWVNKVFGAFAGDPDFLEAMRLGRKYGIGQRGYWATLTRAHQVASRK
jgi:hypothetical protein